MNIEGIRTKGCKLCVDDSIDEYEKAYFDKKLTVEEIVKELQCSKYAFYNHIRSHLKPEVALAVSKSAPALAEEVIDKQGELVNILEQLKKQTTRVDALLEGEIDLNMIKAFTALVAEQRKGIETLAHLQDVYFSGSKIVTNTYNIEYTQVVDKILQTACSNCKPKFLEELKPIIKKDEDSA